MYDLLITISILFLTLGIFFSYCLIVAVIELRASNKLYDDVIEKNKSKTRR
jgi:hypothetical protein